MPYLTFPKIYSQLEWGKISGDISEQKDLNAALANYVILSHTWTVSGEIFVADGDNNYICPIFVRVPTGKSIIIISAKYRLSSAGTANVSLKCNANPVLNYSNISVDDATNEITADSDEISDSDMLSIVVNSVNAEPKNLSFTIFYVYQ
jgi:hypothetical protein